MKWLHFYLYVYEAFSMSTLIKNRLAEVCEKISVSEIEDALQSLKDKGTEDIVENFLQQITNKLSQHPIIGKAVKPYLSHAKRHLRETEYYKELTEKIIKILKEEATPQDLIQIKKCLDNLRDELIDYLTDLVCDVKKGLRHIHAPGSVATTEGMNLYFGEEYTQETLCRLALRVCGSIALGNYLGLYSEDDILMLSLKQLIIQHFKSSFKIGLKYINVYENEADRPYALLLGFIIWLSKKFEEEPLKPSIQPILEGFKKSSLILFYLPPQTEKWCTIGLPRLDSFINNWILDEERRMKIEKLRGELNNFILNLKKRSKARTVGKEVEKDIEFIMNNYEAFCKTLIEEGILDFYAMRRVIDVLIELTSNYDLRIFLATLGSLTS